MTHTLTEQEFKEFQIYQIEKDILELKKVFTLSKTDIEKLKKKLLSEYKTSIKEEVKIKEKELKNLKK